MVNSRLCKLNNTIATSGTFPHNCKKAHFTFARITQDFRENFFQVIPKTHLKQFL